MFDMNFIKTINLLLFPGIDVIVGLSFFSLFVLMIKLLGGFPT